MTCSNCGAGVPDDASVCPNCGAPVGEPTAEERKLVTVLFADLAGSTALATHLDPERYREVMQAFYQTVSRELASLRGRAEKFVGDAVMAVFGLPHAHDDDALRAVRAGLIIRDRTERLGEVLGLPVPLRVRVGINSGAVAIGPGGAEELVASLPEEVQVLSGAAGWAQDDGALGPLAEILRREIGVERGAPSEVVARKLRDLVDGYCEPTESERIAAQLGLVLGLGEE